MEAALKLYSLICLPLFQSVNLVILKHNLHSLFSFVVFRKFFFSKNNENLTFFILYDSFFASFLLPRALSTQSNR